MSLGRPSTAPLTSGKRTCTYCRGRGGEGERVGDGDDIYITKDAITIGFVSRSPDGRRETSGSLATSRMAPDLLFRLCYQRKFVANLLSFSARSRLAAGTNGRLMARGGEGAYGGRRGESERLVERLARARQTDQPVSSHHASTRPLLATRGNGGGYRAYRFTHTRGQKTWMISAMTTTTTRQRRRLNQIVELIAHARGRHVASVAESAAAPSAVQAGAPLSSCPQPTPQQ